MKDALCEANKARAKDEVPVGAVIVVDGRIIARGHNLRETRSLATAHAEINAINKACKKLKTWYLTECTLYVTMEPCPMCMGAIINSRIRRVVFGAYDRKAGCCGTLYTLQEGKFNHTPVVVGGVMEEECSAILTDFFAEKRKNPRNRVNSPDQPRIK